MATNTCLKSKSFCLKDCKLAVPKSVLLLMAGAMWFGVGIMLDGLSCSWLQGEPPVYDLLFAIPGFVGALMIHHFGFRRLADRNLARILPKENKSCIFSFMPWKSYILIPIMILFGFLLRHSPIPKPYLATLYIGIGTALILSSLRYFRNFLQTIRND